MVFPKDTLAVISLDEPATKIGPRTFRKRILRYGRWSHPKAPGGVLDVDLAYGQKLVANFSAGVWDHVAVTNGHPKDEADALDKTRGHVMALEADPSGVYAIFEANADTAPRIGSEILGCSAGLIPDYTDHEVGGKGEVGPVLGHLALTNEPYIKDLGPFEVAQLANTQRALLLSDYTPSPPEDPMTLAELVAKAKEDKIDPKELATALGIDVAALEAEAEKAKQVPTLEAELEAMKKKGTPAPPAKAEGDETPAGDGELVAALGEALAAAEIIELAEGEKPTVASVTEAIVKAVKGAQESTVTLAEARFETAFANKCREGKAIKSQHKALKDAYVNLGEETFDALTSVVLVDPSEIGTVDTTDLTEPPGAPLDVAAEVTRYAELAASMGD